MTGTACRLGLAEFLVHCGTPDRRSWDGHPCCCEGLLTGQFGVLAVALARHGVHGKPGE